MTLSITEYTRLQEEHDYFKAKVKNLYLSKSSREAALAEVRKLEKQLGLKGENYNGKSS